MNTNKIVLIVVAALVIAGGIWFFVSSGNDADETTTPPTSNTSTDDSGDTASETPDDEDQSENNVIIIYTNNGFNPESYTVKVGGTVTVRNDSDETMDFASDNHPTHTVNSELNAGEITQGETKSFTVDRVGTWGFHNHERDSHTGSITVE